ncbi:P27 family phage terminase small subunit [Salipiger sp. 1_MG-2023]|uniref:P27 family phage terminase small subunit n=1 Tax=Salipiger sp. 1_MG-2023 TaxID=3062665 RepID=UPI0026E1C4B5|nr:P27 family phage terminase small subunit [Salipiger sp. 1_MG-2023]MDO6587340.1 P27 family phage terminase small subunit [Salipiger sp. 1_MG-2023]
MTKPRQPRYADIFRADEAKRAKAAEVWHETIAFLDESGLLNARRVEIADRYARACAEYHTLYPLAAEEGPVKVGPNGGDVFNFNWSACEKLNDRMAKFEDALLLSPKAAQDKVSAQKVVTKKTAADGYLD